jgi:isopentenyl-diphosphate delta-isomerase
MEYVVLVDEQDKETGKMEKLQAHVEGRLHRAISVFIFNSKNELLLQQRAAEKYHSALLWTNTCCSHPRPGEHTFDAANRRLMEEMGIACDLSESFDFIYNASVENGLTEHEYDHVFTGSTDAVPAPDSSEVASWRYIGLEALHNEMQQSPGNFTVWFRICIDNRLDQLFNR